jgi:pimeloyl-ACP methyl ester carboxylesterase
VLSVGTVSATGWAVIAALDHPVRRFWTLPGFVLLWRAFAGLSRLGSAGPRLVRLLRSLRLLRTATAPLFRHARRMPASVISALADELRPRSFTIATGIARGYLASSTWAGIECPVRAAIGDRDVFARESDLAGLRAILPESTRAVIDDCGHFGLIERPAAVLRALGFVV